MTRKAIEELMDGAYEQGVHDGEELGQTQFYLYEKILEQRDAEYVSWRDYTLDLEWESEE